MVSSNIVKILDLVDSDDPIFTGKSLLKSVEDWALVRETHATNTVSGLARREQRVVVVV